MKITDGKIQSALRASLVFLLLALPIQVFAYTYILSDPIIEGDNPFVVLEDDFDSAASVVDSNLWTTWKSPQPTVTFSQGVGDGVAYVEVEGTSGVYYDAHYASKKAFNPYERKTEFTFSQNMGDGMAAYAYNRNYISTSNTGIDEGFGIWWQRYPYGRVKLYEYRNGSYTTLLYDSGNAASYVSQYSFSLVLDGANYEFYWVASDTDGTRVTDNNSIGTHSLSKEDIGNGLYMGFGLNTDGKSGTCYSQTYHAGVSQYPTPAIHGTWDVLFRDNFNGNPVAWNGDPDYDQGLIDGGWYFGSVDDNDSIKRTGDGRLRMTVPPTYGAAQVTTNATYSFLKPIEFYIGKMDSSSPYPYRDRVRLFDPNSNNEIVLKFQKQMIINDETIVGQITLVVTTDGVEKTLLTDYITNRYSPGISLILTDTTLDIYYDEKRDDVDDAYAPVRIDVNDSDGHYSYYHNFSQSVIESGFKLQLIAENCGLAYPVSFYFGEVVIARAPEIDIDDANYAMTVDVGATTGKELDPYKFCASGFGFDTIFPRWREIFDSNHEDPDSLYNEFIDFTTNEIKTRTFRYPSGAEVENFFYGIPATQWAPSYNAMCTDPNSPLHYGSPQAEPNEWIEVDRFFEFLTDADFRTYMQVNTWTWFDESSDTIKMIYENGAINYTGLAVAANAVKELAEWVRDNHYQRYVKVWEIGNEDYYLYSSDPNSYAIVAAALIREIDNVFPDATIIVTNQLDTWNIENGPYNLWSEAVLVKLTEEDVNGLVDGITHHNYYAAVDEGPVLSTPYQEYANYSYLCPDDCYQSWGSTASISYMGMLRERLDDAGYPNAQIYLTEWSCGGMLENYRKAMAGGLGNLHFVLDLLGADRVDGAAYLTLMHGTYHSSSRTFGTWGYDTIEYEADPAASPRFITTPVSEIYNLVWEFAQGKVLECTSSKTRINAYATLDEDKLRVIVFNEYDKPEEADDVLLSSWLNIKVPSLSKDSQAGDIWNMTLNIPADLTADSNVSVYTYGDDPIDMLGDTSVQYGSHPIHELLLSEGSVSCNGSQLKYQLQPHSVALFVFDLIPNQASSPSPSSGGSSVSTTPELSWTAKGSECQNLYFGTDSTPDSSELVGSLQSNTFDFDNILSDDFSISYDPIGDSGKWIGSASSQATPPYSYDGYLQFHIPANASIWQSLYARQDSTKCPGVNLSNGTVTLGWQSAGFYGYMTEEGILSVNGLNCRANAANKGITVFRSGSSLKLYIRDINGTLTLLGSYTVTEWSTYTFKLVVSNNGTHIDLYARDGIYDPMALSSTYLLISEDCSLGDIGPLFAGLFSEKASTSTSAAYYRRFDEVTLKQELKNNTSYYWKIDQVASTGTVTGTTWNFTTVKAPPTFVAAGTAQSGTGNITVPWPTHQTGDIALLFIESCGGQAANLGTLAGFAAVTNSPQSTGTTTNGTRFTMYWCRATSSSMSSPVVTDPGDHVYGQILTFRGVTATGNPWDVTAGGVKATASTTTTFGTVTTAASNELIVLAASRDNDSASAAWSSWTNANLLSLTECSNSDSGTTSGNGGGIVVSAGIKTTAGSVGSSTATVTSSKDGHMTIALKP